MVAVLKLNPRIHGDSQMTGKIQKVLIGASVLASVSAIATAPAQAITLVPQNITFNTNNYQTYTGGNSGSFKPNDSAAAISALQDSDPTSNVELWYTNENPTANVGFSGEFISSTLGTHTVSVSSVTAADWAIFGNQWLNDLLASNSQINNIWNGLSLVQQTLARTVVTTTGLTRSGDPNIGSLTLDEAKGNIELTLLGDFDLKSKISNPGYTTGNFIFDTFLRTAANRISGPIQVSEVAKLTIDGKTYYAYGFNATPSGIKASDDQESYTGIYRYDPLITLTPTTPPTTPPTQSVPEPTAIGGLLLLGGLMATRRCLAS
jgi:hypothetical protein